MLVSAARADQTARRAHQVRVDAQDRLVAHRHRARQALLDDAQVHLLGTDIACGGLAVQLAPRTLGRLGLQALHAKAVAAAPDLHIEARLEQAQVRIERPAQARKPRVVGRLQVELARDGNGGRSQVQALKAACRPGDLPRARAGASASVPRSECGRASVTTTSTKCCRSES